MSSLWNIPFFTGLLAIRKIGFTISEGKPAHWPVDHYFQEGIRHARFWGEDVTKYHKTLTTYVNGLIKAGFCITHLVEPQPDESMLDTVPEMRDELRRPMMLLIAARKN